MIQTLRDAESAAELATIGDTLTQHVDSEQDRKRKQIMNQMAFLRSERDAALSMVSSDEHVIRYSCSRHYRHHARVNVIMYSHALLHFNLKRHQ